MTAQGLDGPVASTERSHPAWEASAAASITAVGPGSAGGRAENSRSWQGPSNAYFEGPFACLKATPPPLRRPRPRQVVDHLFGFRLAAALVVDHLFCCELAAVLVVDGLFREGGQRDVLKPCGIAQPQDSGQATARNRMRVRVRVRNQVRVRALVLAHMQTLARVRRCGYRR